jgi:hypothetical protein
MTDKKEMDRINSYHAANFRNIPKPREFLDLPFWEDLGIEKFIKDNANEKDMAISKIISFECGMEIHTLWLVKSVDNGIARYFFELSNDNDKCSEFDLTPQDYQEVCALISRLWVGEKDEQRN